MRAFEVEFEIGDHQGNRWENVRALVDTGSSYTWLPRDLLGRLGVEPSFRREFETADGRITERDIASTMARLNGRAMHTPVVFADSGNAALLGVVTLEEFGLGVDPVNERLIPVRPIVMVASPLP